MEITKKMDRVLIVITISVALFSQVASGQESHESKTDTVKKKTDFIFSLGGGFARFMGDVQDQSRKANVHLLGNRAVFDFHFGAAVSKSFTVSSNVLYGKLSGNENTFKQNRNFETTMVLAGVTAEYNFAGLYNKRLPVLNPFINTGLYYGSYWNISTDLTYNNGEQYYYWEDGIYNLSPDDPDFRDADPISRDFEYETELVDGTLHTFNISAGFGVDLHISRALSLRLMSRYFFAINDKVDGHSTGSAEGLNDGFFYNSVSLVFNAMAFSKNRKDEKPNYKYLFDVSKLNSVEQEDQDGDGVVDLMDRCAATPKGIEVDKEGCPLDVDMDGIPDFRDKNTNSQKDEIVDKNGASINYELIAQKWEDSPNVYGIEWDKKYSNPRFRKDEGYTVNVDITSTDNKSPKIQKVLRIPELRKEVLNDSLIVYRLGVYEKFEEVEAKRKALVSDGIYSGYSVAENASIETANELSGVSPNEEQADNKLYGIEASINEVKTSNAYKLPQLDYTISRFERYLFDNYKEASIVDAYLQALSAFIWDETIKTSYDTVYARLEGNPVAKSVRKVQFETVTSESQELAEREVLATDTKVVEEIEETEGIVDTKTDELIQIEEELAQTSSLIKPVVSEDEAIQEEVVQIDNDKQTERSDIEVKPMEPVEAQALAGDELEKAINQIRASSNLKSQPRINYAPVKPRFKAADLDEDNLISAKEIQIVLQDILKGESEFTSDQFNEMNEYFTEFTQNVEPIDFGGTKVAFVNGVLTILKTEGGEYEEDSRRLLARKYKEADFNKDGELTPNEVQKMIDLFLKGGSSYSAEKVHELIDLYFD